MLMTPVYAVSNAISGVKPLLLKSRRNYKDGVRANFNNGNLDLLSDFMMDIG